MWCLSGVAEDTQEYFFPQQIRRLAEVFQQISFLTLLWTPSSQPCGSSCRNELSVLRAGHGWRWSDPRVVIKGGGPSHIGKEMSAEKGRRGGLALVGEVSTEVLVHNSELQTVDRPIKLHVDIKHCVPPEDRPRPPELPPCRSGHSFLGEGDLSIVLH